MKSTITKPIIITAANEEYAFPLSVMLKSLESNLEAICHVTINILFENFSESEKNKLTALIDKSKITINWVKINHERLQGLKINGHISIATYYRLLIEETFPHLDKVIYLDADIIINRCICKIWRTGFKGKHLLAVPHASKKSGIVSGERGLPSYKILGIPSDTRTFNAGVLMLNLKLWRRDNISSKVIDYLRKYHEYVLWWDQDGLNAILYDKWQALSATWNVMTNHLATFTTWEDSLLSKKVYEQVCKKPAIIHFAGHPKPWHSDYAGLFRNLYFYYVVLVSKKINSKTHYRNYEQN